MLRGERGGAGVLVVEEAVVRKGNGEGFEPQFEQPLHEGVEFRVLDARGDWLQIELPDEKTGWIRADQASLIGQGRSRAGLHR